MIVTSPKNYTEALKLAPYSDYFLLGLKDYTPNFLNIFSLDEIISLSKIKNVIVRLDTLILEQDIKKMANLIAKLKEYPLFYYVTDLGLLNILKRYSLLKYSIYDPFTMITNKLDAKTYYDLGLKAVAPSLEIPFMDLKDFKVPLFYLGFGRRLMFNSKRCLVSLYKEEKALDFPLKNMTLKEEKREDILPIFEDKATYIYRSYFLNNLLLVNKINDIEFVYLESLDILEEKYDKLVISFFKYTKGLITESNLKEVICKLDLPIELGFTYQDSIYQKEEIINEKN